MSSDERPKERYSFGLREAVIVAVIVTAIAVAVAVTNLSAA